MCLESSFGISSRQRRRSYVTSHWSATFKFTQFIAEATTNWHSCTTLFLLPLQDLSLRAGDPLLDPKYLLLIPFVACMHLFIFSSPVSEVRLSLLAPFEPHWAVKTSMGFDCQGMMLTMWLQTDCGLPFIRHPLIRHTSLLGLGLDTRNVRNCCRAVDNRRSASSDSSSHLFPAHISKTVCFVDIDTTANQYAHLCNNDVR